MLPALLIRGEHLKKILDGVKTWEIRGTHTKRRGLIALVESGTGRVVGCCTVEGSRGPLTIDDLNRHRAEAGLADPVEEVFYDRTHAWVLENAVRLPKPVPYDHPSGAVIWVQLVPEVENAVRAQLPAHLLAESKQRQAAIPGVYAPTPG